MSGIRTFGISARPVEDRDVADALHQGAAAALRETGHECLAGDAVPAGGLHLDEFVIVQRARRLAHDRLGEAGISHADDRLQGVGESAQVPFLALAQFRGGGRGGPGIEFAHARHCRSAVGCTGAANPGARTPKRGGGARGRVIASGGYRCLPGRGAEGGLCTGVLCDQASKPAGTHRAARRGPPTAGRGGG